MDKEILIEVKQLGDSQDVSLPSYATDGSAGMDMRAAVMEEITLQPGERVLIPTGLAIALPSGYEAQIRPRSGLAIKNGIILVNSPGTIDSDYRGEIKIILYNSGREPFKINRGDRIAQMIISRYERARLSVVESLPDSERGTGGFGHTGNK